MSQRMRKYILVYILDDERGYPIMVQALSPIHAQMKVRAFVTACKPNNTLRSITYCEPYGNFERYGAL